MPNYTWPQRKWIPSSGTFRPRPISQMSISPYTGAIRAANSGVVWVAEMTWPPADRARTDDADELQAFINKLEGPVNPVWIPYWPRQTVRGLGNVYSWSDGTFFSDGTGWLDDAWNLIVGVTALAGSKTVTLTGFPPSQQVLWRGDVLQIDRNLIEINDAVYSDVAGVSMVPFLPGLRVGVSAGTPVRSSSVSVLMRLDPSTSGDIDRDVALSKPFSLRFVEALDVP